MIELKPWSSIGQEEEGAALRVLRSGTLSGFLGGVLEGGPEVVALEREWAELNGTYAVAVNSATSGILIALKAVGVGPGDEVICSPYSMSAGVACILWCGATPVFADIGNDYCLDLFNLADVVNSKTKAILVTNLFGGVANHLRYSFNDIPIIEDNAQAPLTHKMYGDIMVDSYNVHKPMQAGEGGMCSTSSPIFASALKQLRNHGELCAGPIGLNLRMTEISAAIAREQIKKGPGIIEGRRNVARQLIHGIGNNLNIRIGPYDHDNAYYILPMRVDANVRDEWVGKLQEKGVPIRAGYGGPLYRLPAFAPYARECRNCELIESELMIMELYAHDYTKEVIEQIIQAFKGVASAYRRKHENVHPRLPY